MQFCSLSVPNACPYHNPTATSFPEMFFDSLCRHSLVVQTHSFISCPGGWSQMIPQVKKTNVEVLGWSGYTWSAVVRACCLKWHWRLMVEKLTLNSALSVVAFYCPQDNCTCVMIMLFNLDMTNLSGRWIILAHEKCSLTGMQTHLCIQFETNKLFVHMEYVWDILHVAFIFVSSR
jgi:hypothetical protein